jgi:hypothetical protein
MHGLRSAAVPALVAIVLFLLSSAPPGGSAPGAGPSPLSPAASPSNTVSLLPSATTASTCIAQSAGSASRELPLEFGTLQTNVYAAPAGTGGNATLCYDADTGRLSSYVNWTHVGGSGGWFSYPQLAYGVDDYEGAYDTYTNQSPTWTLPETVATTVNSSLWVTASYHYVPPSLRHAIGYDLSFDNFLSEGLPPTFENGPFIEILVLLDHHLVSHPAGWIPWSMTTLVNSKVATDPWYVGYWCHGAKNSSSPSLTFDFSYNGSAETTVGLTEGTIGVNLSAVLREVDALVGNVSCWTGPASLVSKFYLGQQVFGSEAGIRANATVSYRWTESRYCLHVNVTNVSATTLDCASVARRSGTSPGDLALPPGAPLAARRRA